MATRSLHWFRKGLRLHDNPALLAAIDGAAELYPVFVLDPNFGNESVGANRYRFLLESLKDLDDSLRRRKSQLYVVRGTPATVLPQLFDEWKITRLTFEVDTEPYARVRDAAITTAAEGKGVTVVSEVSHTLWDMQRLQDKQQSTGGGTLPGTTLSAFQKLVARLPPPPEAKDAPSAAAALPPSPAAHAAPGMYEVPAVADMEGDMGFDMEGQAGAAKYPGGETAALARLDRYVCEANKQWVLKFEKPKTSPNSSRNW